MSQDQVRTTLGTPTTTATVGSGTAFYYISSTTGQTSFFKPVEKDRKVLAVYFNPLGSVDRVAQYGLKDGKVFDYVKQETPSPARDEGILKALFRNLGTKQLGPRVIFLSQATWSAVARWLPGPTGAPGAGSTR